MARIFRPVLIGAVVAAALASAPPAMAKTYRVSISKMAFAPVPDGLRVGDTIEWVNADIFRHTVTAKDGSFDVDLEPNKKASIALKNAGTVAFFCKYHPGMTGQLIVAK